MKNLDAINLADKNIITDNSDPIWFTDINIIFEKDRLSEFFPNEEMTTIEKLNSLLRLSIYLGILLAVLCKNYLYLYIPVLTALITYSIYQVQKNNNELFENSYGDLKKREPVQSCIKPTVDNPFMNYNQITSERDRKPACPSFDNNVIRNDIEDKFNTNLYRDVSDLYGKNNNQRQYYTTPGSMYDGGIGDQTAFAKWCYSTGPTCKDDGIQCTGNYTPQLYTATPIVNR